MINDKKEKQTVDGVAKKHAAPVPALQKVPLKEAAPIPPLQAIPQNQAPAQSTPAPPQAPNKKK